MTANTDRRRSVADLVWPDVTTARGRRDGLRGGVTAAGCLALSYLVGGAVIAATGDALDGPLDASERPLMLALEGALATMAALLGWQLWRTEGRAWAWAVMVWAGIEAVASLATAPGRGLLVTAVVLLGAIGGVRATRERPGAATAAPQAAPRS